MKRPLVRSRNTAMLLGGIAFVVGAVLIHDAFEGRGINPPWPLGAFMPW